ncbi:MAG: pyridoxal-phosphate dependent enzyme [Bradymonadaceae bacterium]
MEGQKKPGRFGSFGGRYVAESLWSPLQEVADAFDDALVDEDFLALCERWLDHRIGRPTPVSHLLTLSEKLGGAQLWVKREDLCQGGAFCINSAVLQALLARRMGRTWLLGETATGDFGVGLASIGSAMGLKTKIFMGREDQTAEPLNVRRMQELGAEVETVDTTVRGRKRACAEALRYWATHSEEALYCTSSLAMPDPFPRILEYALSIIGAETRVQLQRRHCAPEYVVAPVGSGAFAAGFFSEFIDDEDVQLVGVQGGGDGQGTKHAASLLHGRPGVFLGTHSYLLQDDAGQVLTAHTVAGGLSMPNVGPQHARWSQKGRVHYATATDEEAFAAVQTLVSTEGLLVCLESGHALAYVFKLAPTLRADQHIVVGLTGNGIRDLDRLEHHQQGQGDSDE